MDISDHYGIFHILDKHCATNDFSQLLRVINESRIEKYKDCILHTDWTALTEYVNCETYYKHFIDKFKNIYDHVQCTPDISRSCIPRNRIYRGRMLAPIFWPPISLISGNSLDPVRGRQFFAKSANRGYLWSGSQETIFREICSGPVWLTCQMPAGTHAVIGGHFSSGHAHQNTYLLIMQNGLKYDYQTAK